MVTCGKGTGCVCYTQPVGTNLLDRLMRAESLCVASVASGCYLVTSASEGLTGTSASEGLTGNQRSTLERAAAPSRLYLY